MKKGRKKLINVVLVLLAQVWLFSCSGGHVTQNGLFQHGHKELKSSLIGSWRIINPGYELMGEELYTFYAENNKVKLKVKGKETEMERFDSSNGLSFSFEFLDDKKERVYVVGQFKSNAKQSLVLLQEPMSSMPVNLSSVFLEKGRPETKSVVAGSLKN